MTSCFKNKPRLPDGLPSISRPTQGRTEPAPQRCPLTSVLPTQINNDFLFFFLLSGGKGHLKSTVEVDVYSFSVRELYSLIYFAACCHFNSFHKAERILNIRFKILHYGVAPRRIAALGGGFMADQGHHRYHELEATLDHIRPCLKRRKWRRRIARFLS